MQELIEKKKLLFPKYKLGDKVSHRIYGRGVVKELKRGGRIASVQFDKFGKTIFDVKVDELSLVVAEKEVILEERGEEKGGAIPLAKENSLSKSAALRIIEALRLGVVPENYVENYTVGREKEHKKIKATLEAVARGEGKATIISGSYGTGKTHLIDFIEEIALKENFIVGKVTLGIKEVPPSNPQRVYRGLISSLRYPDEEGRGLEPLLKKAVSDGEILKKWQVKTSKSDKVRTIYHLYLTTALSYYYHFELMRRQDSGKVDPTKLEADTELLMQWIEGYPSDYIERIRGRLRAYRLGLPTLYSLKDYRPWSRIYSYILTGISNLARDCGYKGMVALLDEGEFYSLLSSENREFAEFLFKSYSLAAYGVEGVNFRVDPLVNLGGYGILKRLPPVFKSPTYFYPVVSLTPPIELKSRATDLTLLKFIFGPDSVLELEPLKLKDYVELVKKLINLYREAYPKFAISDNVILPLSEIMYRLVNIEALQTPRQAIKLCIELMDAARLKPERFIAMVEEIKKIM